MGPLLITVHLLLGIVGKTLGSHSFSAPTAVVTIPEDATIGTSVHTADVSQTFGGVSYDMEEPTGKFAFENGLVTTAASLDCESQDIYEIPLFAIADIAEDTATATLTVTISDVNDHTPVFNPPSYGATIPIEGGIEVLQVSATDGDCTVKNNQISYSLTGLGFDVTTRFIINDATGVITTSQETPIEAGFYLMVATAMDAGGLRDTAGISVTVSKSCGSLPLIDLGTVTLNSNSTLVGATANVSCNPGFRPDEPEIVCLENGNWEAPECIATTCSPLVEPINGTVDVETRTVGSNASFECDAGFDLIGTALLTCLANGNWSARPPTCTIKDCGDPPSVPNSNFTTDTGNTTFGSTATYKCNPGYTMTGRSSIVCLYNATWEQTPPTCTLIVCNSLQQPNQGSVSYSNDSKPYGSTANFSCNTGYELSHTNTRTCLADGTWNGTTPSCIIKKCSSLQQPNQGSVSYSNDTKPYGSTANYSCNTGYELSHSSTRTCLADGTWNGTTPSCIIKKCISLQQPNQGSVSYSNDTKPYGSTANFSCNTGYELSHTSTRTCLADGTWNGTTPSCIIKKCSSLQQPSQGSVSYSNDTKPYGSTANYSCNTGYELSHTSTRTCLADGTWNGTTPSCIIKKCNSLQQPSQGSVSYSNDSKPYGSTANFSCNTGYELSHTSTRTCLADGTWNGTTPSCIIKKCISLRPPSQGSIIYSNDTKPYGSTAKVSCNTGYELSHTNIWTCLADGTWNGTTPSCIIKKCSSLQQPNQGSVSYSNDTKPYGSTANYSCNTGYELSHTNTRTCLADGTWNGTTPSCIIKKCNSLQQPSQGSVSYSNDSKPYGSTANFSCNTGYELSHTSIRNCLADGTWNGTTPSCIIKKCSSLQQPSQRSVSYSNYTKPYGSTANFSCNTGYELSHTSTRNCLADGTWNGTTPSCTIKKCSSLQQLSQGSVSYSNDTKPYGSTANFSCNTGYELSHTSTRTCLADGTWNGTTPSCTIKNCNTLTTPTEGSIIYDNNRVTFGSKAMFTCSLGYTLSHNNARFCLADGTWNGTTPTCNINKCSALQHPTQGSVSHTAVTFGSSATFACNPGYVLSHGNTRTCTADGTWNGTTPSCNIKDCNQLAAPSHGTVLHANGATTFGSTASFSCSSGFTLSHSNVRFCTVSGAWNGTTPICNRKDCGQISLPAHVSVTYSNGMTTFESTARFTCAPGYAISNSPTLICRANQTWSGSPPTCTIKDCGQLSPPPGGGSVITSPGTTFNSTATSTCPSGFTLYGDAVRTCLSSGFWSGVAARCTRSVVPVTQCPVNVDSRQTQWNPTPAGTSRVEECPDQFTGNATRKCDATGHWEKPIYNCIREKVRSIRNKVTALNNGSTKAEVQDALEGLSQLTVETTGDDVEDANKLTHGELSSLSSSFKDIATVIDEDKVDNKTQNDFFAAASDLIDPTHSDTWEELGKSEGVGAERIITSVDSVTEVLTRKFKASDTENTVIAKKNIVVEVKKIDNENIDFPDLSSSHTEWEDATTSAFLSKEALNGANVYATGVIFKDMSGITTAQDASGNTNREINGAVLAFAVDPPIETLDPPLRIVFEHSVLTGLQNPSCSFLQTEEERWSTTGCTVVSSNSTTTVCECNHLTNFAVLMSPFVEADAESKALRIISIVGIGISIVCLIATLIIHFYLWRFLRSDRTTILMHLCVALLVSYVVFLAGVDRTESRVFCAIVAAFLQYIYLVVFCVMLAEGVEIGITLLFVFVKRSRVKPLMIAAWAIPAVIVAISLGVTKADGYGNDNFCWLSVDSGLIWAFVGPAVAIILFNLVCLTIVLKVMFSTKAMAQKKKVDKAKTGIRSLLVLVPLMGVSWILGIFYINKDFYWIQYVFAICNGLQGFFIFLFHCLLNPQISSARAAQKRRKSSTTFKSTVRTTSRGDSKIVKDHSSNEVSKGKEETDLKRKGSSAEKYLPNSISEEDQEDNMSPPFGVSNGSNIRLNISSFNKSSI